MIGLSFLRDVFQREERKRMALTVLGIVWGTASVVLMLSIGEGVKRSLVKGMRGMGEDVVVVWGGETSKPYRGLAVGRSIPLREADVRLAWDEVREIQLASAEYTQWSVYLSYADQSITTRVNGVYPTYEDIRAQYPEPGGRFINDLDMKLRRRVAFIGNETRDKLFGDTPAVGKTIYLNRTPFTVVGVLRKKLQTSAYQGMDRDRVIIPSSTFKVMFGHRNLSNMVYKPKPGRAKAAQQELYKTLGRARQFDPEDKETLRIWDTVEQGDIMNKVLLGVQIFLGLIGGLTLIVAGVGVANIMYVVVQDRTRDIGIKMAVGAKPYHIVLQYVVEALITVLLGGALGMGFSYVLIRIIAAIPIQQEALEFLGKPVMSLSIALMASGLLGLIGFLAGIFPARRAASVDPVEALRYE